MALPISKTPILTGKEAERFRKMEIRNRKKKANRREVEDAINTYIGVMLRSPSLW